MDAGVALSLANLCFLNIWTELLDSATADFLRKRAAPLVDLLVTVANVLLVAAVLFAFIFLSRRLRGRVRVTADIAFLALALIPVNIARTQFFQLGLSDPKTLAIVVPGLAAMAWASLRHLQKSVLRQRMVLLVLLPLFPLACGQVLIQRTWGLPHPEEFTRNLPLPRSRPGQPRPVRVVWMIFDEFDACLGFSNRSPGLQLPALDRLQSESVYATRAVSPASNTIRSVPSLITGKIVQKSNVSSVSELKLVYRDATEYRLWSKEPNVFSKTAAFGFNPAVAGWFLPYCRMFPLAACRWEAIESVLGREDSTADVSFPEAMWLQLEEQSVKVPGLRLITSSAGKPLWSKLGSVRRTSRQRAIHEYQGVFTSASQDLADQDLDLVFIHWPTPHPLTYFSRRTGDFSVEDGNNYFDALALVDRTVARIRTILEQQGVWDRTVLLVSSDHPLRANLLRESGFWSVEENRAMGSRDCSYIPFMLKLPGQRQALRYDRTFNTVVSGDLLLSILRGEVSSAEQVAKWLDLRSPRS